MKKTKEKMDDLVQKHTDLAMDIALYSVRILAMQRTLSEYSDKLLAIEVQIEKLEAQDNGGGLN